MRNTCLLLLASTACAAPDEGHLGPDAAAGADAGSSETDAGQPDSDGGTPEPQGVFWMAPNGGGQECSEGAPCGELKTAWKQARKYIRNGGKEATVKVRAGTYFGQWVALNFSGWSGAERLDARITFEGVPAPDGALPTFIGCIKGKACTPRWSKPGAKYQFHRPYAAISIIGARHAKSSEPMVVVSRLQFERYHNPIEMVGSDHIDIGHSRFRRNGGLHAPTAARDCAGNNKPCSRKSWQQLMDSGELPQTTGVVDASFSRGLRIHDNVFANNHNVGSRIAHIHSIYIKFGSINAKVVNNVFRHEQGNIRFRAASHGARVADNIWYGAGKYFRSNGTIAGWTSALDVSNGYKVTGGLRVAKNLFYWGDACPKYPSVDPRVTYNRIYPNLSPTRDIAGFDGTQWGNKKLECRASRGDNCATGKGCQ